MGNNIVGFILAGGKGMRIKELTKDKPKFFLEINGKRIIDYHLDKLSKLTKLAFSISSLFFLEKNVVSGDVSGLLAF